MHGSKSFSTEPTYWALTVAVALWAAAFSGSARAQSAKFAVVPVTKSDEHLSQVMRLAEAIDGELEQRQVPHVRVAAARGLFETQHSREPIAASKEDIDLLVQAGNKALAASSNADWKTALEQLKVAMAKGARALESTNRNYKTAQHLFHACLLAVQGMVENGSEVEARRQAIECRVRSPGMELPPDSRDYPPYVRDYLVEAREALANAHTAPLLVTSEPSGCAVYVNGRRLGTTPYRQDNPARRTQLVQVECGEGSPGRVHTIEPADHTPPLVVNTVFESSVATDGGILRLRYLQNDDPHVRNHVRLVAEALGATYGLAVTRPHSDRLAITRYGEGPSATVTLRESFTAGELADALATLLSVPDGSGGSALVADASQSPEPAANPAAAPSERHASRRNLARALGIAGTALGGGAFVGAWWLHAKHRDDGAEYRVTLPSSPNYLERGDNWTSARRPPYIAAAAGAAVLTAGASTLALTYRRERFPWWAYAATSTVGVGLAAWGVADVALGRKCGSGTEDDRRFCTLDQERRDRGGLLLINAAPFLLVPAIHYLFAPLGNEKRVSVTATARRSSFLFQLSLNL